ncbi:substrate-binding domain-containing protein [Galbitalea soli]|uniref:Substrate-binding domain-containing protein n=1 Tax=Galbitalea soli TaxID=1268042 RepID=A0A7C9TQS2_9MICO|nr:substrate-binding domain-containing protein [Galbitalea soli]NEM90940.1 substrate-binding domain-containing protein [Galbitalea soli]NYJ29626.1 ribose transport system substrate-binding protein [Galbitalea soli]
MISRKTRTRALAIAALPAAVAVILTGCASGSVGGGTTASPSASSNAYASIIPSGDIVAASKKLVSDSLSASAGFTPKSTGPTAQKPGATIAYVGSDLTNGGVNTVAEGVKEAAAVIGWKVNVYDGKATAQGRTDALNQAIASKPAAIVLGGFDPTEQAATIKTANDAKIPVVGWHAGVAAGPGNGLFANVSTDPLAVSQLAAAYAVADSNGKAGVAIFTDGQYQIAVEKAKAMEAYIQACSGCKVLSYQDSPIAEADQRMPGIISNLLQKNGSSLTYLLAINGNYFGGAQQALRAAGKDPAGPPKSVAAGDGDSAEFQRIRSVDYQAATVAEPLTMEGWEIVDEVNRALAGQQWSGFVPAPGLITKQNVPSGDVFDPASGYRDVYKKVWGK